MILSNGLPASHRDSLGFRGEREIVQSDMFPFFPALCPMPIGVRLHKAAQFVVIKASTFCASCQTTFGIGYGLQSRNLD